MSGIVGILILCFEGGNRVRGSQDVSRKASLSEGVAACSSGQS